MQKTAPMHFSWLLLLAGFCLTGCAPGRVARRSAPTVRTVRAHASQAAAAPSLSALVRASDLVAVGTVEAQAPPGPILEGTTPSDDDWMGNQTTFRFRVERVVKGEPRPALRVIQVPGGTADGVRFLPDTGALLVPGARYLLFLRDLSQHPLTLRHGFVPVVIGGRVYRQSGADVLRLAHPERGQVLLEGGKAAPGRGPDRAIPAWRFETPGAVQIVGVPEAQALTAVEQAVEVARGLRMSHGEESAAPDPPARQP